MPPKGKGREGGSANRCALRARPLRFLGPKEIGEYLALTHPLTRSPHTHTRCCLLFPLPQHTLPHITGSLLLSLPPSNGSPLAKRQPGDATCNAHLHRVYLIQFMGGTRCTQKATTEATALSRNIFGGDTFCVTKEAVKRTSFSAAREGDLDDGSRATKLEREKKLVRPLLLLPQY